MTVGGDPPCWAHLFEDDGECGDRPVVAVVADLGRVDTTGRAGVVWSLPHGGDLDANLVRLHPADVIGSHVNDEVDVVVIVLAGGGVLTIDGEAHPLAADRIALVPSGARREIRAGDAGITYVSVHRRRGPLAIDPDPRPRRSG